MRPRNEFEATLKTDYARRGDELIIELLLDIRALLLGNTKQSEKVN